MMPIEGATLFHGADFASQETQHKILNSLNKRKADVVMSDMAPKATGIKTMDHENIVKLCMSALKFSSVVLEEGGTFLCKLWNGREQQQLEKLTKMVFKQIQIVKPEASRSDSAEVFLL